jgi:hypothetical protein
MTVAGYDAGRGRVRSKVDKAKQEAISTPLSSSQHRLSERKI